MAELLTGDCLSMYNSQSTMLSPSSPDDPQINTVICLKPPRVTTRLDETCDMDYDQKG